MTDPTQAREVNPGDLMPLFSLPGVNVSGDIGPWDYKQHKNLVLIFLHDRFCAPCLNLLRELAQNYEAQRDLNAEVLTVMSFDLHAVRELQNELHLPFPLLSDPDGAVFDLYQEASEGARTVFGVFIADRWGAFVWKTVASDTDRLPSDSEIRDWLSFIEIQFPECFPPKWVAREEC